MLCCAESGFIIAIFRVLFKVMLTAFHIFNIRQGKNLNLVEWKGLRE